MQADCSCIGIWTNCVLLWRRDQQQSKQEQQPLLGGKGHEKGGDVRVDIHVSAGQVCVFRTINPEAKIKPTEHLI